MEKIRIKFMVILVAMLFLAGCVEENAPILNTASSNEAQHQLRTVGKIGEYVIQQDNKTGCMYLKDYGEVSSGLSPYYDATGKVKGCFALAGAVHAEESVGAES